MWRLDQAGWPSAFKCDALRARHELLVLERESAEGELLHFAVGRDAAWRDSAPGGLSSSELGIASYSACILYILCYIYILYYNVFYIYIYVCVCPTLDKGFSTTTLSTLHEQGGKASGDKPCPTKLRRWRGSTERRLGVYLL